MKKVLSYSPKALFVKVTLFLFMACAIVVLAGCNKREWLKMQGKLKKPVNVIAINRIVKYPMAKRIEREIDTFSGRKIWINTNTLMHSEMIKKIEILPREANGKFYDLKLFLNHKGRLRWLQLSNAFKNDKLGLIVDGVFYRSFTPTPMVGDFEDSENTYVIIKGPIDKGTAQSIQKHAEDNYLYYNDDDVDP